MVRPIGTCELCGATDVPLRDGHVVPRWAHARVRRADALPKGVARDPVNVTFDVIRQTSRQQTEHMFCDVCDQHIGDVERMLSAVSLDPRTGTFPLQDDLERSGDIKTNATYETSLISGRALAYFAVSVVYRGSLAEMGGVDLGKFTAVIRGYVRGPHVAQPPECVSVQCFLVRDVRARSDDICANIILPTRGQFEHHRGYGFGIPGLLFQVHVSGNLKPVDRVRAVNAAAPERALIIGADKGHPILQQFLTLVRGRRLTSRLATNLARVPDGITR